MKSLQYIFLLLLIIASCKPSEVAPEPIPEVIPEVRGTLMSHVLIRTYTQAELNSIVRNELSDFFAAAVMPEYDIELYRIVYATIGVNGEPQKASGAVVVPKGIGNEADWLSYQHGTVTHKDNVPSRGYGRAFETLIGMVFGGDGMVVSMPDYLGLGESPGFHPFLHAESEASASVDMLRATRSLCDSLLNISLNKNLFLIGYSQGGHATLALQRDLEKNHANEFDITAVSPQGGPYHLSGEVNSILSSNQSNEAAAFVSYILVAYNEVYGFYDSPSDFFVSPYDEQVLQLLNGRFDLQTISDRLPNSPQKMIQPEVFDAILSNPSHPFRLALLENDLINWAPQAPVRMFHCLADEIVAYAHADTALTSFEQQNANAKLITPDALEGLELDHTSCAIPSIISARTWFEELRD